MNGTLGTLLQVYRRIFYILIIFKMAAFLVVLKEFLEKFEKIKFIVNLKPIVQK